MNLKKFLTPICSFVNTFLIYLFDHKSSLCVYLLYLQKLFLFLLFVLMTTQTRLNGRAHLSSKCCKMISCPHVCIDAFFNEALTMYADWSYQLTLDISKLEMLFR